MMTSAICAIQSKMASAELPALLINDIVNVQWLTGFTGSFAVVLVLPDRALFITDSRYVAQAECEVTGLQIVGYGTPKNFLDALEETVKGLGLQKLGFETSLSFASWETWSKRVAPCELVPAGDILPPLRMVKNGEEVEKIERACKLADACFENVLRLIQPGVREYDISLEIEFFFRRNGAQVAFPPIVASGPNSAKPHGRASERVLQIGDFLTLDFGATLDGYNSDITRTVVLGKASDRQKRIYELVLEAEVCAIDACRPGANGRDIDRIARNILDKDDLSKYFGHSLGHGLGRSVHDYGLLSITRDQPIELDQVWTIEPGVYIDGWGGVRIEDDIVITKDGHRVLTHSPKELMEL